MSTHRVAVGSSLHRPFLFGSGVRWSGGGGRIFYSFSAINNRYLLVCQRPLTQRPPDPPHHGGEDFPAKLAWPVHTFCAPFSFCPYLKYTKKSKSQKQKNLVFSISFWFKFNKCNKVTLSSCFVEEK